MAEQNHNQQTHVQRTHMAEARDCRRRWRPLDGVSLTDNLASLLAGDSSSDSISGARLERRRLRPEHKHEMYITCGRIGLALVLTYRTEHAHKLCHSNL